MPLDKSSCMSVTTKDEYVSSMDPYIVNDDVITLNEKKEIEHILNGHTIQLGHILKNWKESKLFSRTRMDMFQAYMVLLRTTKGGQRANHIPPGQSVVLMRVLMVN